MKSIMWKAEYAAPVWAILGLIAAGIALLIGMAVGSEMGTHRSNAQFDIAAQSLKAEAAISSCVRQNPKTEQMRSCIEGVIREEADQRRNDLDLSAQQDMASWALGMLLVSVVQLPLSVCGVIALVVTIRQGQRAYDSFLAAEDANLIVEFPGASLVESRVDGGPVQYAIFLDLLISNFGRSAARIHGWSIGGNDVREDFTLNVGASSEDFPDKPFEIEVFGLDGKFKLLIEYSSAMRAHTWLEVQFEIIKEMSPTVGASYAGRVISSQLTQRQPS